MKTAKWISLSLICLLGSQGWASQEDYFSNNEYQQSVYSQRLTTKKNPLKGLSLVVPSFVIHGVAPTQQASEYMPRKIDGSGNAVVTPGFGLQYISDEGLLLLGAVVKDCYDGLAGTLQVGEVFRVSDRTNWGLTFGVYARQTPQSCQTSSDGRMITTTCYDLDGYRMKFLTTVNGHSVDIMPMPFVHFTTALYKSRDFRLDFKLMSNIVLNEFGFSVPF